MNNYTIITYLEEIFNSNRFIKYYEILIKRILAFFIDCSVSLAILKLLYALFDYEARMFSFSIGIIYYSQSFIIHLFGFKNTYGGRVFNLSYGFMNNTKNTVFRRLFRFLLFLFITFPTWQCLYFTVLLIGFNNTINGIISSIPLLVFSCWWLISALFNGGKQTSYDKMSSIYVLFDKK